MLYPNSGAICHAASHPNTPPLLSVIYGCYTVKAALESKPNLWAPVYNTGHQKERTALQKAHSKDDISALEFQHTALAISRGKYLMERTAVSATHILSKRREYDERTLRNLGRGICT